MKAKASAIAQKLLNLYRQEHVIIGWAAINPIFINEATTDVIKELREMPTGKMLIKHIENLRGGTTSMDSINPDLLPYGGMMAESMLVEIRLNQAEVTELEQALNSFTPDQNGLNIIARLNIVHKFGDEWQSAIKSALNNYPEMQAKWDLVIKTHRAYQLWDTATQIMNQPLDERARAEIQAEMPEYETYLPMFGEAGSELLTHLRTFISSIKTDENA